MKVLDLQCPHGHRFEGWFASVDDFESQLSRKLVECPVCAATEVSRVPSAPRLNLSGATSPNESEAGRRAAADSAQAEGATAQQAERMREVEARAMRALRELVEKTENVGDRFAEEARRIHYNEAPARNIRGVATPADARSLVEEGIDVMALPGPWVSKDSLQ
jgi:hypothetical protein